MHTSEYYINAHYFIILVMLNTMYYKNIQATWITWITYKTKAMLSHIYLLNIIILK